MCSPMIAAMAVMSAATKAMEIQAQNEQASAAQQRAIAAQQLNNKLQAEQMKDQNRKTSFELIAERRKALRLRGSAVAAVGETGTTGGSNLANITNVLMQSSFTNGRIVSTGEMAQVAIGRKSQQTWANTTSRIDEMQSKKSTGANAALQIGVAAASSAVAGYAGGAGALGTTTAEQGIEKSFNSYMDLNSIYTVPSF